MKKQLLIFLFLITSIQISFSSDSTFAKIVFCREYNFAGYVRAYKIYANDSLVTKIQSNSYVRYNCSPGEYNFRIDKYKRTAIDLKVELGKTYFIKFQIINSSPKLFLVDSTIANNAINRLQRKYKKEIPNNKIGFSIITGFGFNDFPMFTMSNGGKSNISFGGGYGLGLNYSHIYTKHFDLAFGVNYQMSELSTSLENASVTFERKFVSVTPSYVLPIQGGRFMRLKFGGGIDYYLNPILSIETSKLPRSLNDEWIYRNSLGFHLNTFYELNFAYHWSLSLGLKYYNVKYDFKSGGNSFPMVKELSEPNGSGLDFLFGLNYHF